VSHGILHPVPVKIQDWIYISEQESAASARCINRDATLIKDSEAGFLKLNVSMWDAILKLATTLIVPFSLSLSSILCRAVARIATARARLITKQSEAKRGYDRTFPPSSP